MCEEYFLEQDINNISNFRQISVEIVLEAERVMKRLGAGEVLFVFLNFLLSLLSLSSLSKFLKFQENISTSIHKNENVVKGQS